MNKIHIIIASAIFFVIVATQSVFIVHQTEQAIVVQLGDPLEGVLAPGLHFKIPFVQSVLRFEARVLVYDARPAETLTSDKKTIVLDNYARWRIVDPLLFYTSVQSFTGDQARLNSGGYSQSLAIAGAQTRLNAAVSSQLRAIVGRHTLTEVVSTNRTVIMQEVTKLISDIMKQYGIEVVDVRIKRTDLPAENQRAIFGRMRAERERQAKQYRSEGVEESTKLRSKADREQAVLMAEANRTASILRGEGDAIAANTYSQAFSQSPDFYRYQRGLETLKKAFEGKTKMVITGSDPILAPLK